MAALDIYSRPNALPGPETGRIGMLRGLKAKPLSAGMTDCSAKAFPVQIVHQCPTSRHSPVAPGPAGRTTRSPSVTRKTVPRKPLRGHFAPYLKGHQADASLTAEYTRQSVPDAILGTALKVMSNYTNHIV